MSENIKKTSPKTHRTESADRCDTIARLAAQPSERAVQAIVPYLADSRSIVVESAVRALAAMPAGMVMSNAAPLLQSANPATRMAVVEIARRVTLDATAKEILDRLCVNDDADIRLFALEIIAAHAPLDMLDRLLIMRFDENQNVALKAIECLGGIASERAVHALVEELSGGAWHRAAAIEALGRSPIGSATESLLQLKPAQFDDLLIMLHSLGTRADPRAASYLLDILSSCEESLLPHVLAALVSTCEAQGIETDALVCATQLCELPLTTYLADNRAEVRIAAIRLAAVAGTKKHLSLLVEYFAKADLREKRLIVESIAAMPVEEADEILEILANDADPDVAVRALEHLRKGHV